jgi:hypothetical protein
MELAEPVWVFPVGEVQAAEQEVTMEAVNRRGQQITNTLRRAQRAKPRAWCY